MDNYLDINKIYRQFCGQLSRYQQKSKDIFGTTVQILTKLKEFWGQLSKYQQNLKFGKFSSILRYKKLCKVLSPFGLGHFKL